MAEKHILIAEDNKKAAEVLSAYLCSEGFSISILNRGEMVIPRVKTNPPDIIILEVILSGKDGMSVCRELLQFSRVPILMLTRKAEEIDRILGLELGADDYMSKPFSPREVVARVKAILRRTIKYPDGKRLVIGPIVIEEENHTASIKEKDLHLTRKNFAANKN